MATITGTTGADILVGTAADDVFHGAGGSDTFTGGGGRNQFVFDSDLGSSQILDFQRGADLIAFTGLDPAAEITLTYGTAIGADLAVHPVTYVSAQGLAGQIEVWGAHLDGSDIVAPGLDPSLGGNLSIFGGSGADVIHGAGAVGRVWLWGEEGNDLLFADSSQGVLLGGAGNDKLYGGPGDDLLDGDFGGVEPIAPGDDLLFAGAGNDQLISTGGNDTLDGGEGRDIAEIGSSTHGIHIELSLEGVAQDTGIGMMTLVSIEEVAVNSAFDDLVSAAGLTTGVTLSVGGGGHDGLIGGDGDDLLATVGGAVTLTGGGGRDLFEAIIYRAGSVADTSMTNFDTITDFQSGVDRLQVGGNRLTLDNDPNGGAVVWVDIDGAGTDDTKVVLTSGHILASDLALFGEVVIQLSLPGDDLISMPYDNFVNGGANIASYAKATAGVHVSLALMGQAQDTVGAGHDTLNGITGLVGSNFDDVLAGDGAQNSFTGGAGADLFVLAPDGADPDWFWQPNHGADTITDFSHAQGDRVDVSAFGLTGLQQVEARVHQQGADVVISLGSNTADLSGLAVSNTVTLKGVQLSDLTAADFIFAAQKADYLAQGASALAFRDPNTGDWGVMTANPRGGETWHAVGPTSTAYAAIGVGDFNGDGQADIAFRHLSTGAWGYMTAGPGGGETWHDVGPTSIGYGAIGVGDFNGDGVVDIAFRQTATGDWGFMTANPGGGETWHPGGPTALAYSAIGVGDFNLDGLPDIAFRNDATGDWGFMTADPARGEAWHAVGSTSTAWAAVGAGDFNGDGVPDIAFRQTATGDWGFMSANPGGGETWHAVGPTSTAWAAVSAADFDGDGRADLAFREVSTGDWGFMGVSPSGGGLWHAVGPASLAYQVIG